MCLTRRPSQKSCAGFSSPQPRHNYANGPLQTNDSFLLLRQGDIPACVTSCVPCAPRVPRAPRAPCASCVRPAPRVRPTCAPRPVRVPRATLGDGRIVFAPRNASSIFVFDPERGTVDGGWWVVGAGRWEVGGRWWGVRVHTFQKLESSYFFKTGIVILFKKYYDSSCLRARRVL